MTITFGKETYEVRGGAWRDEMNRCFWTFVRCLEQGYILCKEHNTDKLFAMYSPYEYENRKQEETQ